MALNSDEQTEKGFVSPEPEESEPIHPLGASQLRGTHHLAHHFDTEDVIQEEGEEEVEDDESESFKGPTSGYQSSPTAAGRPAPNTSFFGKQLSTLNTREDGVSDAGIESKEEDLSDCWSNRRAATEQHHQAPTGGHYIPDCNPDGGYQAAQCHQLTGYCWCVHQKSGKPIRGTATQGVKPDCEAAKKSARAFKGCSLKKKQRFTEEYLEFMVQEMSGAQKNKSHAESFSTSHNEVAKWKMINLDSNKNQVLDRKEWKVFRKDWKTFRKANRRRKKLRKCWRNYLRFCDANADHRITLHEWLNCTSFAISPAPSAPPPQSQISEGAVGVNSPINSANTNSRKGNTVIDKIGVLPKPRGPNPFDTILKSD